MRRSPAFRDFHFTFSCAPPLPDRPSLSQPPCSAPPPSITHVNSSHQFCPHRSSNMDIPPPPFPSSPSTHSLVCTNSVFQRPLTPPQSCLLVVRGHQMFLYMLILAALSFGIAGLGHSPVLHLCSAGSECSQVGYVLLNGAVHKPPKI